jgi:CrcB protein
MDLTAFALVGLGGALGAMGRYGVNIAVGSFPGGFPLSTLLVNVVGSLLMGLLIGALARATPVYGNEVRLFVAVGVLGGFTTFSSFSLDAMTLIERGEIAQAAIYVGLSVAVSILGLAGGLWLTRIGAMA